MRALAPSRIRRRGVANKVFSDRWPSIPNTDTTAAFLPIAWATEGAANAPNNNYSIRKHPTANTWAFEVRDGDVWSGDSVGTERAELAAYSPGFTPGVEHWVAYSMKIDFDDPYTGTLQIMGQVKNKPEGNIASLSPVVDIAMVTGNSSFVIRTRTSTATTLSVSPSPTTHYFQAVVPRKTWMNFVHRIKIDHTGGGILQSWINGVQRVNYAGAIGYNQTLGPYWKWGIYSQNVPYTRRVKYANTEISLSSLSDRIANPLPITEYP